MAWKLTIDGVDQTDQIGAADLDFGQFNGRAQATFHLINKPDILPDRFAEVVAYAKDGVTPMFGGVVLQRTVNGVEQSSDDDAVSLQCGDFWTYADFRFATLTYPSAVALEDVIADLTAYLTSYGLSYTPTATGITLAAFSWQNKRVSDAFRELIERIPGHAIRFTPSKTIVLVIIGAASAPVSLTDANAHCLDLEWSDSTRTPANKVILTCGPPSDAWAFVDPISFQADGVASSWVFDVANGTPYTDDGGGGTIHVGGVIKNSAVGEFTWTLDEASATATLALVPAVAPGAGTVIDFKRNVQPPFIVIATSGASPVIEASATREDVLSVPQGVEIADGLLAQFDQQPKEIRITTDEDGFASGQELTIALTPRSLAGVFIITSVSAVIELGLADTEWLYTVMATDLFQGTPLDKWREILGGGSGSLSSSGGGATVTVNVLSSPVYLGGSYTQSVTNPTTKKLIQNAVPYFATASFTARLRVNLKARDAGVGVKAVISDGTTDVSTPIVTNQTFQDTSVIVAIAAGETYWVYIQNNTPGDGYVGYALLEAA